MERERAIGEYEAMLNSSPGKGSLTLDAQDDDGIRHFEAIS